MQVSPVGAMNAGPGHRKDLLAEQSEGISMFNLILIALSLFWEVFQICFTLIGFILYHPIRAFQRPTHERLVRWTWENGSEGMSRVSSGN